jgi:dephospho-CoA kinase
LYSPTQQPHRLYIYILEADSIAHSVYHPDSEAVTEIVNEFGSHILDEHGQIDRKQLGKIVFDNPAKMAKLERIVWPHVKREIQTHLDRLRKEHKAGGGVVVLEAAVLLDAGWEDLLDGLWVVTTPTPVALQRLVEHRGFTHEEAQKRIEAQQPRRGIGNLGEEVEKGIVTKVIENEGSPEELQHKLQQALEDPTAWKSETMEST